MQTVSFETAKRLKEAGFEQPVQQMGQWWYDVNERLTLSVYDSFDDIAAGVMEKYVFAPTATDILPEDWLLMRDVEGWICQYRADFGIYVTHENPAEAAAAAWFRENERK